MKLKADLFPYPVLSTELDDFSTGKFFVDVSKHPISITKLQLVFNFVLDNLEIGQLVSENKAKFVIHLEGEASAYRKLIYLESHETFKEVELDVNIVPKRIFVNTMVITTERILNYKNKGFNSEYYGENFTIPIIEKGSILAYDSTAEVNIDFDNIVQTGLKSMIRVASKKQNHMDVDMDGDVIQVNLPEKSYSAYVNLSNASQAKQVLLLTTIILPALTMVVEKIRVNEVDESLEWYKSLGKLFEKLGYEIEEIKGSSENAMFLSQKLLDFPLDNALYDFYKLEEGDNN